MNILDLKKLMLVPLACCILVQQTDAATMEVNDEKFKVSYKDSPKDIEDKFLKWVEHEEETGASERVTDQNGRKEKIKTNLRVAFDVVTRCGLDWKECQLGGVVASVRDNDRCGLCVYKGVKKNKGMPEDNSVTGCLYKTNKASHTERQLICAVRKKWKDSLSGQHFIYTALPPCANGGQAENGNLDCCTWYIKVLDENPWTNFYIFFRAPRWETLKGYARFDTYAKLRCLWTFVTDVLGGRVYEKVETQEKMRKGLGDRPSAVLANLRNGVVGAQATEKDCEVVEDFLFGCLMQVMENLIHLGNLYNLVKREEDSEYAASVEQLYRNLIDCYDGHDNAKTRIHFHCLVAAGSE